MMGAIVGAAVETWHRIVTERFATFVSSMDTLGPACDCCGRPLLARCWRCRKPACEACDFCYGHMTLECYPCLEETHA